jgi:CDP-diacylglycerol--serine O-phosphatidyltransferase
MIIGKWNKSVILSYIGLMFSLFGMFLCLKGFDVKYALICFGFAGVCDMFDGTVARRCKRTKEEKAFGIELDSLIDVASFAVFPIIICMSMGLNTKFHMPIYALYLIFAVARLAYFNIALADENKAIKYYEGLPVTMSSFFLPIVYLLSYVLDKELFNLIYSAQMLLIALLFIFKIKIPKPGLKTSFVIFGIGLAVAGLYLFVL